MFSRSVGRVAIESPWRMPPTFLLPMRARLHTSPQFVERDPPPTSPQPQTLASTSTSNPARRIRQDQGKSGKSSSIRQATSAETVEPIPSAPEPVSNAPLSETVKQLLPSLASQGPHYATIHIHARPYMVTEGDTVLLPFHMPKVQAGDVLRLNRASLIGSRDFTLQGQPYVDDRLFECRAVVMGVEAEPMRFKEKTKQRNRRIKTVKSKQRYTKIAVRELRVKHLEEIPQ